MSEKQSPGKSSTGKKQDAAQRRADRLKAALRQNLHRRKAQTRVRKSSDKEA